MKIKEAAEYLQKELISYGFTLHRYNAYSTNSIYLKLDWGAMNSIRISDHKGYDHLSYKYNIDANYRGTKGIWKKDNKGYWKYFIGIDKNSLDTLIKLILNDRFNKQTLYKYEELIEKYKVDSQYSKGFWQKAWEVKLDG